MNVNLPRCSRSAGAVRCLLIKLGVRKLCYGLGVESHTLFMREIPSDDMSPVDAGAPVKLMGCQGVVSVENNS